MGTNAITNGTLAVAGAWLCVAAWTGWQLADGGVGMVWLPAAAMSAAMLVAWLIRLSLIRSFGILLPVVAVALFAGGAGVPTGALLLPAVALGSLGAAQALFAQFKLGARHG